MAEQEVIKHTKRVYKIWNSKTHSFWHKVKEFAIEIFIIVFAVSLSIWLHDKSEHNHEQKNVTQFLLGLREDLGNDIVEMRNDMKSYQEQGNAFSYIMSAKVGSQLNRDSLKKYSKYVYNTTWLIPNNGRFEGFKSSGDIGKIENYEIQNDILDLYQENIQSLLNSTSSYIETKKELWKYIRTNRKLINDSTSNIASVLTTDEAQNLCGNLIYVRETIERYSLCIAKMEKIISYIDKTYPRSKK